MAVLALVFLGLQAVMVVWPFFVIEKFHWSSAWIGYSLAPTACSRCSPRPSA
ncbi:hypothetical protein P4110_10180 [Pseudomonas aeruginosa]|nr:hypothetical protein [Pseudomonas aeruginosa]